MRKSKIEFTIYTGFENLVKIRKLFDGYASKQRQVKNTNKVIKKSKRKKRK